MPIISNFKKLAKNSLREKALLIAEAGYEAIEINRAVNSKVKAVSAEKEEFLIINTHSGEEKINLKGFKRIFIVGIGKGSALASAALAKILGERLNKCIALDINKPSLNSKFLILNSEFFTGSHPLPSEKNIQATREIIKLAKNLNKNDLLINFICGGGSALLCGSEKEMEYSKSVFKYLTKAGADILELNIVRKHLSEIKGGGLAKLAYPANVISLIVSDVLGNDLSIIASGPTVYDKTTNKNAEKILKKYGLEPKKFHFHENPKQKKYFKKVKNILFICNNDAIMGMAEKSKKLEMNADIYSLSLKGEAKESLWPMIEMIKSRQAVLAAGETTVVLKNMPTSKGGRNMEAVLGAISKIQDSGFKIQDFAVLSFASDGHDNTEAAGAIADYLTLEKAKKLNLNPIEFLNGNKSFSFFEKIGDLIFAEKKCFNVADLMLILKK
ncbi:DUF4147 domain-containing protein [Candidatus Wolfebacteria bacterium]|nr:DUF4147 domain-containing protein [Candidatus Wolfebacteria bacterium]